jgi:hypothetical protein
MMAGVFGKSLRSSTRSVLDRGSISLEIKRVANGAWALCVNRLYNLRNLRKVGTLVALRSRNDT